MGPFACQRQSRILATTYRSGRSIAATASPREDPPQLGLDPTPALVPAPAVPLVLLADLPPPGADGPRHPRREPDPEETEADAHPEGEDVRARRQGKGGDGAPREEEDREPRHGVVPQLPPPADLPPDHGSLRGPQEELEADPGRPGDGHARRLPHERPPEEGLLPLQLPQPTRPSPEDEPHPARRRGPRGRRGDGERPGDRVRPKAGHVGREDEEQRGPQGHGAQEDEARRVLPRLPLLLEGL